MIPVIVLTSLNDERVALDALQHGAQDYLCKDELNGKMLFRAIRYSIERNRLIGIKDEFISTVSHELRTPLTSINGSLSLIVAEASAEQTMESALDLVKVAQRNCERLVRLVNDLLDIQKMEAGKYGITTEPVELVSLIKQAIESNAGYAHKYRVDLKFEADVQESWVTGDADKLSQVMSNLLSNAEKFSPKGSVVLVQLGSLETAARVSVADKGKGIPEALQSYLFEKFTQVDSSTRREKGGTGLGLSICKRIIELHGGQIGFSSTIGKGTTFSFELPVIAAPADESVL
jgi:signal transduction histidine kinase